MNLTPKTIIYATGAVIVLYVLAKHEATAAVDAVVGTVNDAYTPVKKSAENAGSGLFDFLHPSAETIQARRDDFLKFIGFK